MNVDEKQIEVFNSTLGEAARKVCPMYGVSVEQCIRDAATASTFGKFAIHNNYFALPGEGNRGHNLYIRAQRTGRIENGGYEPQIYQLARFSSPEACVEEYCKRQRGL